jgi:hypothetical protein
MAWKTVNAA